MCGIAGIYHLGGEQADASQIRRITQALAHRGPDAEGTFVEGKIALGHRRLSIIDLSSAANQPLFDHSGRYALVFNGEIYNFEEVKKKLIHYPFSTHSDSEVLLAAYATWGAGCLEHLKGMFAFAIWDREQQELFVARDRMGVKPLYYFNNGKVFIFASEIRAVLASGYVKTGLDLLALKDFFSYQSVGAHHSIIKDVRELEAGTCMRITHTGIQQEKYWDIFATVEDDFSDAKKVQRKIDDLLRQSVARRLVSDVPLGAFLSGGIDSSAVVGLMAEVSSTPPNTFTVAFDEEEFDESSYASIIARKFNTDHHEVLLRPASFLDEVHNALDAMDTPSGDGINTYVVSKAIRQNGITVALSGIGGDELFAGYPIFRQYMQLKKREKWWSAAYPFRKLAASALGLHATNKNRRLQQLLGAGTCTIDQVYPVFRQVLSPKILSHYLSSANGQFTSIEKQLRAHRSEFKKLPWLSQVSIAEYLGYTQHTLLKDTDQMSMAVALEVREPFFDHDLVRYVLSIPDNLKYPVYPKSLLVESVKRLLPDEIVFRKKKGFVLPWEIWMKNELRSFCETRIRNIAQWDFINGKELQLLWSRFLKGDKDVRWLDIWLFVVLEYWLEKNLGPNR